MNRISCLLVLTLAAACGGSGSSQVALSARAGTAASTAATAAGQQSQPLFVSWTERIGLCLLLASLTLTLTNTHALASLHVAMERVVQALI